MPNLPKPPETKYVCVACSRRKILRYIWKKIHFCLKCRKKTKTDININIRENVSIRENLKVRREGTRFKKFISEFLGGWFSSGDPKLKDGVYKTRNIDKEKDTYDEVVKDYKTGKIIHECHESLSEHRNNQNPKN